MLIRLKNLLQKHNLSYIIIWGICLSLLIGFTYLAGLFLSIENQKELSINKLALFNSRLKSELQIQLNTIKRIANDTTILSIVEKNSCNAFQNITLEIAKKTTDVSIIYILNTDGTTIASTQYDSTNSLLGQNYRFRPYFTDAIEGKTTVFGALGITTQSRGIYLSTPITLNKKISGVLIFKLGLEKIDTILSQYQTPVVICSPEGVIFATNQTGWLFRTIHPLTEEEQIKVSKSKQFSSINLLALPYNLNETKTIINGKNYQTVVDNFIIAQWKIINTFDADIYPPITFTQQLILLLGFIALLVLLTTIILLLIHKNEKEIFQSQLIESERKYKSLVENSGSPIIYFACNGDIIFINDAASEIFEKTPSELTGTNAKELITNKESIILDRLANVIATHQNNYFEDTIQTSKGKKILGSYYQPVLDNVGKIQAIQVISQDITTLKNTENEALILHQFAEEASQGFIICNKEGIISYANRAFVKMTTDVYQSIENKNISKFYNYTDSAYILELIAGNFEESEHKSIELPIVSKSGKNTATIQNLFPIKNKQENTQYVGIVYTNISERKIIEEKLKIKTREIHKQFEIYRKLSAELQEQNQTIEVINKRLHDANEQTQKSNELKNAFISNISQEIRTPINNILGFSQLIVEPDADNDSRNNYIDIISKNSDQLLVLINDIIDVSKIESKQLFIKESVCNLNSILDELYLQYTVKYKDSPIELRINKTLNNEKAQIFTDELRLRQLITNIVNNAYKYTKIGTIEISYAIVTGNSLRFSIKDTGVGINTIMQQTLLENLKKDNTQVLSSNYNLGLALALCKGIIEMFKGKIWFSSEQNKGTIFYFEIPYKPIEAPQNSNQTISQNNFDWKGKNLLIVEDDSFNALFMKKILEKTGISMQFAKDGEEALHIVSTSSTSFDAVLMDMNLPIKDGFETTRILREQQRRFPIIAQTAFALTGDKEKCLTAGCNDYITKPIKRTTLLETLAIYLS